MRWEYTVEKLAILNPDTREQDLTRWLNDMGDDGWELVDKERDSIYYVCTFKRPAQF